MSDGMAEAKGPGRGKGRFTAAGVQAQQASDIEELKEAVLELTLAGAELEARVEALEAADEEPSTDES